MTKQSIGEAAAIGMHQILKSQEFNKLFHKTASTKCCECSDSCDIKCACKDKSCADDCYSCAEIKLSAEEIVDKFTSLSAVFDELGLEKTASLALNTAEFILAEIVIKNAQDLLEKDISDVSDRLYNELLEISKKYPDLNREIRKLVIESPKGTLFDEIEPEGLGEEFPDLTEITPVESFKLFPEEDKPVFHAPQSPQPSDELVELTETEKKFEGTADTLEEMIEELETEKELANTEVNRNDRTMPVRSASDFKSVKQACESLDAWLVKHAEEDTKDDESFEEEEDE